MQLTLVMQTLFILWYVYTIAKSDYIYLFSAIVLCIYSYRNQNYANNTQLLNKPELQ